MEPTEHNRRAWDEIHGRGTGAMRGRLGIPAPVRERLPDLEGKHVLHLQCGTGESTAELSDLGALVTGVDISSEAIKIAHERAPTAAFIQSDVQQLPIQLEHGRFDLVFTGGGVLTWLQDLDAWLHAIVGALKPGGSFFLYDGHPVGSCLDITLRWREDYFDEEPQPNVGRARFDLSGPAAVEEKMERFWRLGQIATAVAQSGLLLRSLEEFPEFDPSRHRDRRIPGDFVLIADKPREA
jgi:ubiquinone/menaquinone biosynthesis C-methylase UbiE